MKWVIRPCIALAALLVVWSTSPRSDAHEKPLGEPGSDSGAGTSVLTSIPCQNGLAGIYPCRNVDLMAYLPLSAIGGGANGNDVWGWTDPESGREFGIVGRSTGTAFVEVTNPSQPIYLGNLPTASGNSLWREMKTLDHYALIVSEAAFHGMQIFDLRQLLDVTNPPVTFSATASYNGFSNCHNIVANEDSGYAYAVGTNTCSGGLHMIDLRNPTAPSFAGCFSADGYTHDAQCVIYNGPHGAYAGREICFNSNEDTLTIVDVTVKNAPVMLSRTGYAGRGYTHQGWLTGDQAYFLLDDELDESTQGVNTRTFVWDVRQLNAPFVTGIFSNTTRATDHNQYVRQFLHGEYTFQANYRSGLRILRLDNPDGAALREVAYFDIYPADDNPGYNGAWGNYPFFPSGTVLISGIEQGLFVVRPYLDQATPTPTASPSRTATRTATPTRTASVTATSAPTQTPTRTRTATFTPLASPTSTGTPTVTPTWTLSATPTFTATITPTFTPGPPGLSGQVRYRGRHVPVDGVEVALSGPQSASQQSGIDGGYVWEALTDDAWRVEASKLGGRGSALTAIDAALALQGIVGLIELDEMQRLAADANGSGTLSAIDASLILRHVVGLIDRLPVSQLCASDWAFAPLPAPATQQSLQQPGVASGVCTRGAIAVGALPEHAWGQDFEAILFGDVNASWQPPGGTCASTACAPQAPAQQLRAGTVRRDRRGRIQMPLYLTELEHAAASAVVRFDASRWRVSGIRRLAPARRVLFAYRADDASGEIHIALASATALAAPPNQPIATVLLAPRQPESAAELRHRR
jgi:choice-of-anchor B domain-containing protein